MTVWLARLTSLFRKRRLEDELEQDIQEHLEMAIEENLLRGMSPSEAAEAARRSFGGRDQMKEAFRDQRGIPALETCARELRLAFRSLGRDRGFALLAAGTLALAIGANAAIFSAVNALLFHPSGIRDPASVVVIRSKYDKLNLKDLVISLSDFQDVRDSTETFSAAAIAKTGSVTYTGGVSPRRLTTLNVSSQWFDVLGARPAQGRIFSTQEDQPNNNQVAILTDAAWRQIFGADPSILGKTIDLDQLPHKVIGIMGPEYSSSIDEMRGLKSEPQQILKPLAARDGARVRFSETYLGVARLRSGVTLSRARAFMGILTSRGFQAPFVGAPRRENGWGVFLVPYTDYAGADLKTPLLILWGAVGFVLLIACSNVAGLTLARTSARSRELAVRTALGGSRWHLLRQLFAESFLLAMGGSTLGLAVAYSIIRAVEAFGPQSIAGGLKIPFDLPIVLFTMAAGILSAVLFGIAPAAQIGRVSVSEALKGGGRSGTQGHERTRVRSTLVTSEVALAMVLSIGSGLLLRSLNRLQQADTGFHPEGVMTAGVTLPEVRYKEPARQLDFFRQAIEKLKALPGAQSAAAAYPIPFGAGYEGRAFFIIGRPVREHDPALQAQVRLITPEFFSTLRIPLKRGRPFNKLDAAASERVTIIDETLAQQYWPNEDPLGQQILQDGVRSKIVGIAGHTKQSDLAIATDKVFYYPFYQDPINFATLLVRTEGGQVPPSAIQEAIGSIDPAQPIYDAKTMQERVNATLAGRRFTVVLLAFFASTAVFLAALGLYGVVNYGVTQRTQEIGIRMALGAQRPQVLRLIAGNGLRLTALGLALGGIAGFGIARLLPNQLFGVSAFDLATFASMALLLASVSGLASYIPARRAMRLDPVEACRYE